jgi:hypothetical protein
VAYQSDPYREIADLRAKIKDLEEIRRTQASVIVEYGQYIDFLERKLKNAGAWRPEWSKRRR